LSHCALVRILQEAIDDGASLGELERTLLADGDSADEGAAAWLYAWAYDALRPAESGLGIRSAHGVWPAG